VVAVVAAFFCMAVNSFSMRRAALSASLPACLSRSVKMPSGEQLFVFGEHAEQALDEEVGDAWLRLAPAAHGGGELGELAGGVGGDGGGGFFRAQLFGVGEHPFEELAGFRLDELSMRMVRGSSG
jgi:hypothetical protein